MSHDTTDNYLRLLKAVSLEDAPQRKKRKRPKSTKQVAERAYTFALMKRIVLKRDARRCVVCGFHFTVDVHHIVPIAKGGKDHVDNLVTLCPNHHRIAHKGLINPETLFAYIMREEERTESLYDNSQMVDFTR